MIKKMILLVISILGVLILTSTVKAQQPFAIIVGEHIRYFYTDIDIQSDGSITVQESIDYDFGTQRRHGIYRSIPYIKTNTEGKKYEMDIKVESVTDETGQKYKYSNAKKNGRLELKIGDANVYVTGVKRYVITYSIKGALTYFSDHDELYWNVTGDEWNYPIASTQTNVRLPGSIDISQMNAACYTGIAGSTDQNCTKSLTESRYNFVTGKLEPGQGLTIVAIFPKNIVAVVEPKEYKDFFETPLGVLVAICMALAFLAWYIIYPLWLPVRWFLYGRDAKATTGEVRASFDPPKNNQGKALNPTETGAVLDEVVDMKDILAMVIHLAQRGYIRIEERAKNDFYFVKVKEYASDQFVQDIEHRLLDAFFKSRTELRVKDAKLGTKINSIRNKVYEKLMSYNFFPKNPEKVRTFYNAMLVLAITSFNFPLIITSLVFGRIMPNKTLEGINAANQARSLRNFLASQERQLNFQAENQMMFEKLLPFAVAFGVEKQWGQRFKDLALHTPEWFVGYGNHHTMNTNAFIRSLDSSFDSFSTAATPTSSSSGFSSGSSGGFSGGGGGGGGGGSW